MDPVRRGIFKAFAGLIVGGRSVANEVMSAGKMAGLAGAATSALIPPSTGSAGPSTGGLSGPLGVLQRQVRKYIAKRIMVPGTSHESHGPWFEPHIASLRLPLHTKIRMQRKSEDANVSGFWDVAKALGVEPGGMNAPHYLQDYIDRNVE